jgi:hypothetical protein
MSTLYPATHEDGTTDSQFSQTRASVSNTSIPMTLTPVAEGQSVSYSGLTIDPASGVWTQKVLGSGWRKYAKQGLSKVEHPGQSVTQWLIGMGVFKKQSAYDIRGQLEFFVQCQNEGMPLLVKAGAICFGVWDEGPGAFRRLKPYAGVLRSLGRQDAEQGVPDLHPISSSEIRLGPLLQCQQRHGSMTCPSKVCALISSVDSISAKAILAF